MTSFKPKPGTKNSRQFPYVVAKCAQTLDGRSATAGGRSKWITSAQSRTFARAQRDQFDAILVGVNTVLQDDPRLNGCKKGRIIKKIVLDSSLKTPLKSRLFQHMPAFSCIVATRRNVSALRKKAFTQQGIIVQECPSYNGRIDLKWLIRELGRHGIRSLLIEGGATVLGEALSRNCVQEIHCYVAPKIAGDQQALGSIVGRRWASPERSIELASMKIRKIGKDYLIKAHVLRHR